MENALLYFSEIFRLLEASIHLLAYKFKSGIQVSKPALAFVFANLATSHQGTLKKGNVHSEEVHSITSY